MSATTLTASDQPSRIVNLTASPWIVNTSATENPWHEDGFVVSVQYTVHPSGGKFKSCKEPTSKTGTVFRVLYLLYTKVAGNTYLAKEPHSIPILYCSVYKSGGKFKSCKETTFNTGTVLFCIQKSQVVGNSNLAKKPHSIPVLYCSVNKSGGKFMSCIETTCNYWSVLFCIHTSGGKFKSCKETTCNTGQYCSVAGNSNCLKNLPYIYRDCSACCTVLYCVHKGGEKFKFFLYNGIK